MISCGLRRDHGGTRCVCAGNDKLNNFAGHEVRRDGGTLFLDDVRDVSPALQARLLRVLQARELRRVEEVRLRLVDVRPIAATHRGFATEVSRRRVRLDLYFRVGFVYMRIPPLGERVADVGALMDRLLARVARRRARRIRRYMEAARQFLADDVWPENVYELELAVERVRTVSEQPIVDVGNLLEVIQQRFVVDPSAGASRPLREMERGHVRLLVRRHRDALRRAAEECQTSRATRNTHEDHQRPALRQLAAATSGAARLPRGNSIPRTLIL